MEDLGDRLEAIEDEIIADPKPGCLPRVFAARRQLLGIRKALWPQRESLGSLLRDPGEFFDEDTAVFLRDCHDHVVQLVDVVETNRELTSGLMDLYLSSVSHRMNEVMKVLTIIATIFIPLSFVAGLYGMNFDPSVSRWNMPELGWRYGYPAALAVMAVAAGGMMTWFWRRGWFK
jgi:magnesium transporter